MVRLVLRDLYYRVPMPVPVRWAIRNAVVRLRGLSAVRVPFAGASLKGPWSTALAASQRVSPASAEVQEIVRDPGRLTDHAFPLQAVPLVSVIIPVHGKLEYTVACLLSIRRNAPSVAIEVIIVDDASADATEEVLGHWPGLRYARNAENLGFIETCNRGAEMAVGKYVCFLNNDTVVLRGWLDELCATFTRVPDAGLVGSKLVYPSGKLQESGGILWRDGSAWNYGHLDHPDHPRTSYLRDVDYVSAASIMVPKALFAELGGFDVHFRPAYYEDSDLAFRIRELGRRVLVQPASMVVHYEGITSGRAPTDPVKRFQLSNRAKFYERWKDVLARHRQNGDTPELEKERLVTRRLLMVDAHTPYPDRDAGSLTADYFIRIFQTLGYKVTFAPENLRFGGEYSLRLQRLGVECLYYPFEKDIGEVLTRRGREFDLIFVARPYVAHRIMAVARKRCPRAKLIYNTVDLHYVRELRQAEMERNPALALRAQQTRRQELGVIAAMDCSIVLSEAERTLLRQELPQARIEVIPLIHEEEPTGVPFAQRQGLIFIGGGQHPPNLDAVKHFVSDTLPVLRATGCEHALTVIGNQPQEIHALGNADVSVLGHVPDIASHFQRARCMVVPLRYGAGVKGKIGTAFSYGLPVVSTSVGVEGMDLEEGRDYLRAESPEDWARQIGRLSTDEQLWRTLSDAGRRIVRERYSPARIAEQLRGIIETL